MSGAIPPLPNTPSWRGVQLSTGTTFINTTASETSSKVCYRRPNVPPKSVWDICFLVKCMIKVFFILYESSCNLFYVATSYFVFIRHKYKIFSLTERQASAICSWKVSLLILCCR
jgi:hypothetical protein